VWAQRSGPRAIWKALRRRVPEWLAAAPEMPTLLHDYLKQATHGGVEMRVHSQDLANLHADARAGRAVAVPLALGATLILSSVLLYALNAPGPRWLGVPLSAWLAALAGVACFWSARRSAR
jgi:ubiquinone biosynthesis protein